MRTGSSERAPCRGRWRGTRHNCRMEAQYAFQQQKDMIPLMLEEGYNARGWLGMMLGVRLWYGFFGATLASEDAFEGKMEELCRELGQRGQGA